MPLGTTPDTRQGSRGWRAGAVTQQSLAIQECDGPTDLRTYRLTGQDVESHVSD